MQNAVPDPSPAIDALASRSAARGLERRRAVYADEVRRLVQASFELIRDRGDLEPRVGEIVRAAGLSNQAFYKHFRSKDELLLTVLTEGVRVLASYLEHRMDAVESAPAKIREWLSGVLEQALHPEAASATRPFAVSRARLAELFPSEVEDCERQLAALLHGAIEAGVASGELAAADPERDAETVYNLAMGWVQRQLARPEAELAPASPDDAAHLIEFAMHGLARGSGPPQGR
ncbi:MAG: TetR/AcrR family transcriptional regulator [Proteobacteria bacterium]|nr:TetR/AcrR family transcriptional regulator [Pseudomonadota bacterium]